MKWQKVNQMNWRSLTRENKKLLKRIMRDLHDDILEYIATSQRLNHLYGMSQASYIPFLDGEIVIKIDYKKQN